MEVKIKLDLVRLIQLAAPQVHGSDERSLLYHFLARNRDPQLVDVDLGQVLIADEQNGEIGTCCPYCGNDNPERATAYTWCAVCDSGLFFGACPVCDGDLEASLDPMAICSHCGEAWGEPAAEVAAPGETDVWAGAWVVPPPALADLAELRTWLAGLPQPE